MKGTGAGRGAVASPCAVKSRLLHEGAGAADPADPQLQDLLHGLVHVNQTLQVHTVPQRFVQPGRTHGQERKLSGHTDRTRNIPEKEPH